MSVNDVGGRRRFEDSEYTLHIYPGSIAEGTIYCPITARKTSTAAEVIDSLINKLQLEKTKCYVLAEVKEFGGEEWILNPTDCPVQRMMLWPRMALENRTSGEDYRFLLREKNLDGSIHYGSLQSWLRVTEERRRMVERGFLPQPQQKDYDDLCGLPDLNEKTLLENLRNRFKQEKIYTYVGSILIVINPFKFLPIYNPKYVKMYDNHQLGKLEPHIYAVADVAYHAMLQRRKNQCIVISGESGSGKTQSTNFLIHHLTALSQKGFASGVEQIILGAGPVLEAFGNAKTAHNNNSSRFGKFIQVNYQETGTVRGAYVEKYLLEKSRLVYQEHNERNYHVFYYLLAGASEEERSAFHLKQPEEYHYLNQDCFSVEGEDLKHDFERLQLAMEMVGFLPKTRRQIFSLLSAILHLGNIRYKKKTYRDDSIDICNPEILPIVSELLEVKEEMLFEALVTRKTVTVGEKLILPYKLAEAVTVRNSMAKSLYSALFDWIVFRINHALLNSKDMEESTKTLSIGVLDIFGFEDYENNSFEQFCINFANERLQHYFNQHIFKLEQEEYRAEGISWHNIDYIDNSGCINLISKKPTGLLHLLDEESNFPQATNQTLLDKFKRQHEGNSYIEFPAVMEPAFIIKHYAGKVKYGVKDFREKNTDHMRPDIVALLRSSKNAFICGMIGIDPVAVFRWAVLRAFFRAVVAFREAGKRYVEKKTGKSPGSQYHQREEPAVSLLLSRCHGKEVLGGRMRSAAVNYCADGFPCVLIHFAFSPFFRCHVVISKYLNMPQGYSMAISSSHAYREQSLSFPQHMLDVKSLKHLTNLTLHDHITKSLLHLHKKKKPPSISAQFQASLNKLMETLGQAEPYFVKCIRSNAEKLPLRFSDSLVLQQLRYTGMLETVRIRQSGYSCKYSFQDFVDHFHVLLPQGISPSKHNVHDFFRKIKLNPDNYQVGRTMVFVKERERQLLQDLLHQEVLRRITLLQRWFRFVERRRFLQMQFAAHLIQSCWREHLKRRHEAAASIQAAWRGHCAQRRYRTSRHGVVCLQAACRGYLLGPHHLTPPRSPELSGIYRREFKENKEPSPKVKRKRSVKISNVALEPVQWQNDSLQIITSVSDLKSMDEFLLKKVTAAVGAPPKSESSESRWRQLSNVILEAAVAVLTVHVGEILVAFSKLLRSPVLFLTTKSFSSQVEEHNGHIFKATQYSIPTYCEYCSSLIWIMDRASVLCKYACHKKCCLKTTTKCSKKYDPELSSRQFGVELARLTSEERAVPLVVEKLINYIEMHGLYTEGIYRKSGSTNKIKELRQGLDTDIDNVNLDDYNIHVIASVFKQWLRDLPNPLMTFELYEEFLRAMGLQERRETVRGVYSVIDQLSRTHLSTLERLIFHLVRIALQEETNRMSANALAIVFAPCILRCPDTTDPLQSVQDISKTTTCVELIVIEQMNKYKARLKDINSLEFAENKAKSRLSLIRRSMVRCCTSPCCSQTRDPFPSTREFAPKWISGVPMVEELTFEMLTLEPRASDDETLESEASIGTADSSENLNFDSERAISDRSGESIEPVIRGVSMQLFPSKALHRAV
uniref:Myosin IXA n=1 Tax=Coturnix japonica TaxID=93934 RepID=A0A8C2T3N6_COTJA